MKPIQMGIALASVFLVPALLLSGCSAQQSAPEDIAVSTARLSTTDSTATVLGFESSADWVVSGAPAPTSSTVHSQGNNSLAIKAHGYVTITSAQLSSLGAGVTSQLSFDLMLPPQQPNPSW